MTPPSPRPVPTGHRPLPTGHCLPISVIIPNWNKADLLRTVLSNLALQTYPIERVVVVDNGSTDNSPGVAREAGAKLLRLPRNKGFAYAVNRGVEHCDSEWILVLNNDVTFGPDWLATLVESASAAGAWFAVGKLKSPGADGFLDGTFDAISRAGTAWRCGQGRADGPIWSEEREISLVPLTAALVRRQLFEEIGLLDEKLESYLEDVDFGLRCAAKNYSGRYVPGAVAFHTGSATLGPWHNATVRRIARNQVLLVRKYFRGAPLWPILVGQLLWGIIALRHGAGLSWLLGKLDGLRFGPVEAVCDWAVVRAFIERSETDIWKLQEITGFDLYWRVYFALVPR